MKNRNVFFVGLLSFFGGISQDIFGPILPIYLTSILGFNRTFVGIVEGIAAASVDICKVIAGFVSDKFGRQKPIIFAGYFLSMISRPLLAIVTSQPMVAALRFADGVGRGIKDTPKDVLIAGSSEKAVRGRSFGIARMLDTLGSVAGPLILFALLYFLKDGAKIYRSILFFAAVPLAVTLFILVTKVKEIDGLRRARQDGGRAAAEMEAPARALGQTKDALPRSFYIFLGIATLFTIGNSSDAFLILRARNLGVTLLEVPLVVALFNFIYAMAAVPLGSLSDKIGRIPTLIIGWFAYALVYFGFAIAPGPAAVWFLYGFYGVYYAISGGVTRALLADLVAEGHRGRAFGIYGTTIGLTALPASFFAGALWDRIGPQAPFYFGAVIAAIAAAALFAFSKRLKAA